MEITTLIGIISGVLSVGVGMWLKGADPHALINPAAFLIIMGGTFAVVFNAFPMVTVKKFFTYFKILFRKQNLMEQQEILELFVNLAKVAKQEGVMGIEKRANEITDPFLKTGLTLVADGFSADFIAEVVENDIKNTEERHRIGATVFAQCGMYAPTLGVLGAVIGLIAALGNLSDTEVLGHSIAAAFVATLLGIFCGYVMWHPFSNKLKQISLEEISTKKMMLEGMLALQSGASTIAMEAKLQSFIPSSKRKSLRDA